MKEPSPIPPPFRWSPGQHLAIVGMTGSGKSVLAAHLLALRKYYVVLRSKADETVFPGAKTGSSATLMDDPRVSRLVLSPKFDRQYAEFLAALNKVWRMGGWTVLIDETHYVDQELRLRNQLNRLLTQGRSPGRISVVCGMQRPSGPTRFAIGEASHVVSFGLEGRDAKILADATTPRIREVVETLPRHHFAWYSVADRSIWRGSLDLRAGEYRGDGVRRETPLPRHR